MNSFLKFIIFFLIPTTLTVGSFFWGYSDVFFSPGKLTLGHKKWNNSCLTCHSPFSNINSNCLDCHTKIAKEMKIKNSFHATINSKLYHDKKLKQLNCIICHTDHKGENKFIISDKRNSLQLSNDLQNSSKLQKNGKSLDNKFHIKVDKLIAYQNLWQNIEVLKKKNKFSKLQNKINNLLLNNFIHELSSNPLLGPHKKVKCKECHFKEKSKEKEKLGLWPSYFIKNKNSFVNINQCIFCHKKDDKEKGHKGTYGKNCAECHLLVDNGDWKSLKKDILFHHILNKKENIFTKTKQELNGKHALISCRKCHTQIPFKETTKINNCSKCHAQDDNHSHRKSLSVNRECSVCHYTDKFSPSFFNHDKSNFILKLSHKKLKCISCHTKWHEEKGKLKIYEKRLTFKCIDCHKKNDKHLDSFGTHCEKCHKESSWGDNNKLW